MPTSFLAKSLPRTLRLNSPKSSNDFRQKFKSRNPEHIRSLFDFVNMDNFLLAL